MYRKSELLEIIMKKYNIHENNKISYDEIQEISKKEKIEIKDLLYLLEIRYNTAYKLKKEKQKYTKLKFNNYEGIKNKKIIAKGKIHTEEFFKLKSKLQLKSYTLIRMLGISTYEYNKAKKGKLEEIKVTDIKTKHIVKLIKLDFKYINKYTKGYYTKEKLQNICRERDISLEQFLKYYNKNQKHYKFNKLAIEQSKKGLWIGEDIRIPDEFIDKNYEKIAKYLRNITNKYSKINEWQIYKEDIIDETSISMYEKCGEIVKKFYFDTKLTMNIIIAKGKYIMYNLYRKKYKKNNIYYEEYDKKLLDHTSFLRDNRYNPQLF